MFRKFSLSLCLISCLLVAPQLFAEEAAEASLSPISAVLQTESLRPETASVPAAEASGLPRSFEEIINDSDKVDLAGCSASYYCIHGGSVSCSAPTGTCTSSGQHCGRVTCNGNTTWCPGVCYQDYHCINFCGQQGSNDGYCDQYDCCVCL